MSIFAYNGGAVVAMAGKDCVAIASDNRFGTQFNTIARDNVKIHELNGRTFVGLPGLETDNETLLQRIRFRMKLYKLKEERDMPVRAVMAMIENLLYSNRFGPYFVEPVIAGLDAEGKPYVAASDCLGAVCNPKDFIVSGTAQDSLLGMCESLWQPDMDADQLFECISQALMASLDRDCLAGWGATVKVLTADGMCTTRQLKTRMD
eukprot:Sspe_Gene.63770::Locus_36921_Transcript_1_1_Confidence_1.000_Length_732::g.63770::m.63770/K02735/PSMB3; 20S proteasome subunit beta 3